MSPPFKISVARRVGNHGEGRCSNGHLVDGSIPAPKTVDWLQNQHPALTLIGRIG